MSPSSWTEQNAAFTLTYQVRYNEELCEDFGQGMQWVCYPPEVPMDKYRETQSWYIWWPSNKRTHEKPNVWGNSAWQSLKSAVTNILGNHQSAEYEKEIEELLKSFC